MRTEGQFNFLVVDTTLLLCAIFVGHKKKINNVFIERLLFAYLINVEQFRFFGGEPHQYALTRMYMQDVFNVKTHA